VTAPIDLVSGRRWFDDVGWWARNRPGATAVRTADGDQGLSHAELWSLSGHIAARLRGDGLGPGDAVLVYLDNSVWYAAVVLGCHRAALVVVVASPWNKADELAHQVADAGCRAVVTDEAHTDTAIAAAPGIPVLVAGAAAGDPRGLLTGGAGGSGWDDADVTATTRATLLYTSGTTGRPKGAVFDIGNYTFHGEVSQLLFGYGPDDTGLSLFPMSLAHGHFYQLVTWLMSGTEIVMAPFSASGFPRQVLDNSITVLSLNATHAKMIAARATPDPRTLTALRFVKLGLDLPIQEALSFEATFGGPLVRSYSQTESVGPVLSWRPGNRRLDSVGRPVLGYQVGVWDADERPVTGDAPGQLVLRSAHPHALFRGYHNHPAATEDGFRGGWWRTGDLVRRRDDGSFDFLGRTKDIIKRSGFSVAAAEIERALTDHPAVAESAVVGIPDPLRDETIIAYVLPHAGRTTSADELRGHCDEVLADYKVPQHIEIVDELPRTRLGKIDKASLRDRALAR